jgi:hypothetical protein
MKHNNLKNQIKIPAGEPRPTVTAGPIQHFPPVKDGNKRAYLNAGGNDPKEFAPSPDEVARRAYFTYVNQGSLDGHQVQHWLEAESQLRAERDQTRVHGFHDPKNIIL